MVQKKDDQENAGTSATEKLQIKPEKAKHFFLFKVILIKRKKIFRRNDTVRKYLHNKRFLRGARATVEQVGLNNQKHKRSSAWPGDGSEG